MADYKVTDTELTSIANAIRTKGGTQEQLEFPAGFVSAVQAIPTGSAVVQPLRVTENGTYNPPSGVDGYAPVSVNVSGGGDNKYKSLEPIHFDFVGGYVSAGTWYINDTTARTDIYQVYAGKHYIIHLGSTVGNRFRVAFFATDPALATDNISGISIASNDSPTRYRYASVGMFSPASDGFVAVGKTSQSVNGLISYLVDFEESN